MVRFEPMVPEFFLPSAILLPLSARMSSMVPVLACSDLTTNCSTFCHSMETERRWVCGPSASTGPWPFQA